MTNYKRVEEIAKEFLETFPGEIGFKDAEAEEHKYAILMNHEEFRTFAFLKYGVIIAEDKEVADLDKIHMDQPLTLANILGLKFSELPYFDEYDKHDLFFIKQGIDKFGDLENFQRVYDEFKSNYIGFEVNKASFTDLEVNEAFRKKHKMKDTITIPKYIVDMVFKK